MFDMYQNENSKAVSITRDPLQDTLELIKVIHTLGPEGTNCAAAARKWFSNRGQDGKVILHRTLEDGTNKVNRSTGEALLGCAVYPDLHSLVFLNLKKFSLVDSFVMKTFSMVLASRNGCFPERVSTHPAPSSLVPNHMEVKLVTSNSQASLDCRNGLTDGCITTDVSCAANNLCVVKDFGQVPMVFTLHF